MKKTETMRGERRRYAGIVAVILIAVTSPGAVAQVNSGSDGSDGAFNPTESVVIDMHDHPDGVYQYTSVNIPSGVVVSFIPNAANTPVVWLVQQSCVIAGRVDVSGKSGTTMLGGTGGPGGFRGGDPPRHDGVTWIDPGPGLGPGGGKVAPGNSTWRGGCGSYGSQGPPYTGYHPPGEVYGNAYLLPLLGGSGGSGGYCSYCGGPFGGGGGGGAILIAASGTIDLQNGSPLYNLLAEGGGSNASGGGSGGAVRLAATVVTGNGKVFASSGRVRLEAQTNSFSGEIGGVFSTGLAGIILLPSNQHPRLSITSVGGLTVPLGAAGTSGTPDVMIPGQQSNPMTIRVNCQNIPLNSDILVEVKPQSGAVVSAVGQNTIGTEASSTASVSLNLPPGEGYISARTTVNLGLSSALKDRKTGKRPSLLDTGLASNGERFRKVEITSALGGSQEMVYVSESGKRFPIPSGNRRRQVQRLVTTRPA